MGTLAEMPEDHESSDVVFLLGAGASKAAGVPDTYEFVDVFRGAIDEGTPDRALLERVIERLGKWIDGPVDIERLLDALTRIVWCAGNWFRFEQGCHRPPRVRLTSPSSSSDA
jgi:hypothetical protein